MSLTSAIEWTDSTWNPVTGCNKVSPGCKHCYAETFAERWRGVPGHPYEQGFDLKLWPDRIVLPLQWKKPRRIFVNSMSDLFHEKVPDKYINDVFDVMLQADHHIFQLLTKRSKRMMEWTREHFRMWNERKDSRIVLPKHIWLGVSVENDLYKGRILDLKRTPAKIRFLSIEPLLGSIALASKYLKGIHWVIVGGESGPKGRPVKEEWIVAIKKSCNKNNVPFFFKQWGTYNSEGFRVGKKRAGRVLLGRTWDQMPINLRSYQ